MKAFGINKKNLTKQNYISRFSTGEFQTFIRSHFTLRSNSYYKLSINYSFDKLLIFCLVIVSKVVVKFRYGVVLRDLKYGHVESGT